MAQNEPTQRRLFPGERAEASHAIWHGNPQELLDFLLQERLCTQAFLLDAMQQYNESIANNPLLKPYDSLEAFVDDKGIRSKIAQVYNRTANGDFASYAMAWQTVQLAPQRPPRRTMRDALEAAIEQRKQAVKRVIE
jgi:transposase InsO family protein